VALTDLDRRLVDRCLKREPAAWHEFVDRYAGVFLHVVRHVAHARSIALEAADVDDLIAEVFSRLCDDDFRILRHFRGRSSLPTYLVVVARRIVVNQLARRAAIMHRRSQRPIADIVRELPPELRIDNHEEVEQLLERLKGREAQLVRGFYLDAKSYDELSVELGIPLNSVGPTLHRILKKLRKAAENA